VSDAVKAVVLVTPLGIDCFVVCAALGMGGIDATQRRRVSILFPVLEASAPVVGLAIGAPLGTAIGRGADYAAAAVLIGLALFMLLRPEAEEEVAAQRLATAHGLAILGLGLAVALDELAIGFSIGLLGLPLLPLLILIAVQAVVFTQLGLRLGGRLSARFREGAERLASLALFGIGLFLLLEQLW